MGNNDRYNYHRRHRDYAEKKLRKSIGSIISGSIKNYFDSHPDLETGDWIRESLAKRITGQLCSQDCRRTLLSLIVNAEKEWLEEASKLTEQWEEESD